MTLVVEDGTGKANAESYVSVADFQTYATARGLDLSAAFGDISLLEQALRRGTAYVETFWSRFPGYRTNRRMQRLEWPRVGAYYFVPDSGRADAFYFGGRQDEVFTAQGYDYIAANVVPHEILDATCEAAVREVQVPGSMQPDLERGGAIQSIRAGSVEVVYAANAATNTVVQVIDGILSSLLLSGSGGGLFGSAVR